MTRNSIAAEKLYDDKESYYDEKRSSVFSIVTLGVSFLINALIIGYAILSSIIA